MDDVLWPESKLSADFLPVKEQMLLKRISPGEELPPSPRVNFTSSGPPPSHFIAVASVVLPNNGNNSSNLSHLSTINYTTIFITVQSRLLSSDI